MYIAMEYLPAGNLKEYMSRNGVFDEEVAKNVTEQILQGVHVLHENRIMHRDIKPEVWPPPADQFHHILRSGMYPHPPEYPCCPHRFISNHSTR